MANNSRTTQIKEFPFVITDKQGNEIYYEVDGYWSKKEYDSENREIYCEDSSGFWWKHEFDSDGNIIYFENSRGEITDNRPKDDVITIEGIKYKRIDQ
jgi:hypothetical protein